MRRDTLAVLLLVSACTDQQGKPKPSPTQTRLPAFQQSFVPPAVGTGNFEICLSDESGASGLNNVTLPPGIIFASFGQITGNLRGELNYDINSVAQQNDFEGEKYAVVTTRAATLNLKTPCVLTDVRAVEDEGFRFSHRQVPVNLHLNFQAGGLYKTNRNRIANDLKDPLLSATEGGFVLGTPIKDVTEFVLLKDD